MSNDPTPAPKDRTDLPEKPENVTPADEQKDQPISADDGSGAPEKKSRILIGSQRDPGVALPRTKRDWVVPGEEDSSKESPKTPSTEPEVATASPVVEASAAAGEAEPQTVQPEPPTQEPISSPAPTEPTAAEVAPVKPAEAKHFPPPNIRGQLSADLEAELEAALGEESLDDLMAGDAATTSQAMLEPDTKYTGRVIAVRREDVFVELGSREQGIVPLKSFEEPPEVDAEIEVMVIRHNSEEGIYELNLPHAAGHVGDWSDLNEGMLVDARVTGHNSGGLECEVNHIRGFIPVSQISLYRVEDLAQFVDEKFTCLVTEANPERRNLVLSRRAVLEREKEEAREELLKSLAPGQLREGIVRKLMDFGAFVDLGGIDGLLHISQLGWGRVNHPSEVLTEGQTIKVKIEKIDLEANRISLGYRDMLENPWDDAPGKYPVDSVVQGKVVKLMEFGAFVELEPGIEGLVHISELSHKRVFRTSDVVSEGQEIEVMIKSVDRDAQRIGLSMKDVLPAPATEKKGEPTDEELAAAMPKPSTRKSNEPLKGGVGRSAGGEQFGLKW